MENSTNQLVLVLTPIPCPPGLCVPATMTYGSVEGGSDHRKRRLDGGEVGGADDADSLDPLTGSAAPAQTPASVVSRTHSVRRLVAGAACASALATAYGDRYGAPHTRARHLRVNRS